MKVEIKIPAPLLPYMSHEEFKSKQNTLLLYPYIANGDISNGKVAELSDFIECRDVCNSQALTILQANNPSSYNNIEDLRELSNIKL